MAIQQRKEPTFAIHESSSQSSSAENGELQTPSPHYTEPLASSIPHVFDTDSPISDEPAVPLDPHFAQLLSALAISASSSAKNSHVVDDHLSAAMGKNSHPQGRKTPALASVLSTQSPGTILESTKPSVSVHAHKFPHPDSHDITSHPRANTAQPELASTGSERSHPSSATPSSNAGLGSHTNVSSRSASSRMAASTADISPYLSRPSAPTTTSADRLKHIALLEAVSVESARLMQAYKTANAKGLPVNINDNFKYPVTPSSVSATSMASRTYGNPLNGSTRIMTDTALSMSQNIDDRVLYASGPGTTSIPVVHNGAFGALNKTLQARSKTSLAYHHGSSIKHHPSGNASMSQYQLSNVMGISHTTLQSPYLYTQQRQSQGSLNHSAFFPPLGVSHPPTIQQAMLPHPVQFMPYASTGPFLPLPASTTHTPLQTTQHSTNHTLLSILNNTRNPSRASNARTPYLSLSNGGAL